MDKCSECGWDASQAGTLTFPEKQRYKAGKCPKCSDPAPSAPSPKRARKGNRGAGGQSK